MNFPLPFITELQQQFGEAQASEILAAMEQPSYSSVRRNPLKWKEELKGDRVVWAKWGEYLQSRPVYTLDPKFHAGAYYVQEASSMFLEQAFVQLGLGEQPIVALDLCAAPGGKSTHIVSLLHEKSLLVSNEVIRNRATILKENLVKWGYPNICIVNNDPEEIGKLEGVFDVIVVDAPCSGEGMFRKDHDALAEWSEANVKLCAQRQQRILADIWPSLKQGGYLIYTTCTFNHHENDDNVKWLIETQEAENVSINHDEAWGIETAKLDGAEGYRFLPHKVKGEGLFMSVFRKNAEIDEVNTRVRKPFYQKLDKKKLPVLEGWLKNSEDWEIVDMDSSWIALPKQHVELIQFLKDKIKVIHAGFSVGELKGKDLIPAHDLALSTVLDAAHIQRAALDLSEALRYLRKDDILPQSATNGLTLLTYEDLPIGWGKKIGNRFNNYYPVEWRIRMEIPK